MSFLQDSTALGTALGRAGAHEIAHYLLQQAYDSSGIQGVMHDGFAGNQWFSWTTANLWKFNSGQIWAMNNRCRPASTDTSLPNNYINPRSGGQVEGGSAVGIGLAYPTSGLGGFLSWVDNIGGLGGYGEVIGYEVNPKKKR